MGRRQILDPNNGKTYKVRMKPIDGGKKLEVRGYIGMPLLGRTPDAGHVRRRSDELTAQGGNA